MRLFRPPFLAGLIYPEALFRMKTESREVCLSFDDGPDPEITPAILEILERYKIKAVFFCCGSEVVKYPGLAGQIISGGHVIGNHGFKHLNGWKTTCGEYINDVILASGSTSSDLFRPPYGALCPGQYRLLKKSFRIIFWDLMPYDFDTNFGAEKSLKILKKRIRPGSVIVLHNKSTSTVLEFLSDFLDFAFKEGYRFTVP